MRIFTEDILKKSYTQKPTDCYLVRFKQKNSWPREFLKKNICVQYTKCLPIVKVPTFYVTHCKCVKGTQLGGPTTEVSPQLDITMF